MSGDEQQTFEEIRDQHQPAGLVVLGVAFVVLGGLSVVFDFPWFVERGSLAGSSWRFSGGNLARVLRGK